MKQQKKKKSQALNIVVLFLSISIGFLAVEITLSLVGTTDKDGNFMVFDYLPLPPTNLPVKEISTRLKLYTDSSKGSGAYDPELGWTYKPEGKPDINRARIRSNKEYALKPPDHVFRVALFGDSFTFASDVAYEHSWGFVAEQELNQNLPPNVRVEVINFGVGGYGIDQAYLRWEKVGRKYNPHLVIFGFQPENVYRNVNLIRPIYLPSTGIPFSKPRFILDENGKLKLINSPTVSIENLPGVLKNFRAWEFSKHEYFYSREKYQKHAWQQIRALSLIQTLWQNHQLKKEIFLLQNEPAKITVQIIKKFESSVKDAGADFLMVHLPNGEHLADLKKGEIFYKDLLEEIKKIAPMIHAEKELLSAARKKDLSHVVEGHYTIEGYKIVGKKVAESVEEFLINKRKVREGLE